MSAVARLIQDAASAALSDLMLDGAEWLSVKAANADPAIVAILACARDTLIFSLGCLAVADEL